MNDIDSQKLFANFEEIYVANGLFWKNHFLKTLKTARQTGRPLKIDDLYDGFIRVSAQVTMVQGLEDGEGVERSKVEIRSRQKRRNV